MRDVGLRVRPPLRVRPTTLVVVGLLLAAATAADRPDPDAPDEATQKARLRPQKI